VGSDLKLIPASRPNQYSVRLTSGINGPRSENVYILKRLVGAFFVQIEIGGAIEIVCSTSAGRWLLLDPVTPACRAAESISVLRGQALSVVQSVADDRVQLPCCVDPDFDGFNNAAR
jgi:hypothetical protein